MRCRMLLAFAAGCLLAIACAAQEPDAAGILRFEAEDYTEPKDAWLVDKDSADRWNLWSTDQNAAEKWSGGIVLRSPQVKEERATPEDGAPVLHTRLTDIPVGTWHVELVNVGRTIAVSLDGETWRPFTGGFIARGVTVDDGVFEFWVDDRYVHEGNPGWGYYDAILLHPAVAIENGVGNAGFETVRDGAAAGWNWWSREGGGSAVLDAEHHGGERSVKVEHDGERDWALSNSETLTVKPGDEFTLRGWLKLQDSRDVRLVVVGLGGGQTVSWDIGGVSLGGTHPWTEVVADVVVPKGVDAIYVRATGGGRTLAWIDDISLTPGLRPPVTKPRVEGSATTRVRETIDRGVVALPADGGIYVGWRLFDTDPAGVAFNLYRQAADQAEPVKVNGEPVRRTTDFLDTTAPDEGLLAYTVRPVVDGREGAAEGTAAVRAGDDRGAYVGIPLQGDPTFQKVGIGDLDGDGRYDYVIKTPNKNIDPYDVYWERSPDTYKLEAYTADGTLLWRQDLGWGIERGIWYSPYLVYDFDGDGRAEVAAKIGEGDPRSEDGRVMEGPEWLVVWDGQTGAERARVAWPDREGFGGGLRGYNYSSRNQLAVAYLDGKTPCLVALRGTYTIMKADAYELVGDALRPLWQYRDHEGRGRWQGQGAHFTHAADVDGDGRDEVVLGSAVIDDTGAPLWTTGRGHPDHAYVGDIDPRRPGLEIYYGIETRNQSGGMALVDAATGETIWGWDQPTTHVHATGMCADIDPTRLGMEGYSGERDTPERWLWAADGTIIERDGPWGLSPRAAYWDGDLHRELIQGRFFTDHLGGRVPGTFEGSIILVADVLGDWREELVCSLEGELRIYSTTIPAADRRPTLMQDPIYRGDVAMTAMGYTQIPTLSYLPAATAPNLNLTALANAGDAVQVVVGAPMDRPLEGTLKLASDEAVVEPAELPVKLAPGELLVRTVQVGGAGGAEAVVRGELATGGEPVVGEVKMVVPDRPLTGVPMAQGEDFAGQGGGEVQVRDDKGGVVGKAISHWDNAGHWLTWTLTVPQAGEYRLVVRYSAAAEAERAVQIDGVDRGRLRLPSTGGFGATAVEWLHATLTGADGKPLALKLDAGEHTVRLENLGGKGANIDYLALVGR